MFGFLGPTGAVAFGFRHPFVLTILAALAITVATIPAGERETGYLDLLLARPVARVRYLGAIIVQLIIGAILLPVSVLAGAIIGLGVVEAQGELPWTNYVPAMISVAGLMLAVSGYTLLLSSGAKRRGTAIATSAGWTLGFFIVDSLAVLWSPLTSISWVSPFWYCRPVDAAVLDAPQVTNIAVLVGMFFVSAALAIWRFQRQDL